MGAVRLPCSEWASPGRRTAPEYSGSVVCCLGSVALQHVGMLVLRPGTEHVSPALEGGFLATGLPGKSLTSNLKEGNICLL